MKRFAFVVVLSCHHDPAPVTAAEPPPLPPASGTPIGYLIDDPGELRLSSEQVAKLREIDSTLASELDVIDTQLREANRPAASEATPAPQQSGRHGGRRGGGGMGRMGGGGGAWRSDARRQRTATTGDRGARGASSDKLSEQRTADVRDALHRAFDVLDAGQQATARQVLAAHDVDLDTQVAPEAESSGGSADPP
jgi:hypothetical protein